MDIRKLLNIFSAPSIHEPPIMSVRSFLKDLHDATDRWKINVRVFRKWNVYHKHSPTELLYISTLLIDPEGTKIQAAGINKSLHTRFLTDIKEGTMYLMANFVVSRKID